MRRNTSQRWILSLMQAALQIVLLLWQRATALAVRRRKEIKNSNQIHQEEIEDEKKKFMLMKYEEIPDYMKNNEFIVNYYRDEWPLKQAFFSFFQWHNETLNAWTYGFISRTLWSQPNWNGNKLEVIQQEDEALKKLWHLHWGFVPNKNYKPKIWTENWTGWYTNYYMVNRALVRINIDNVDIIISPVKSLLRDHSLAGEELASRSQDYKMGRSHLK